MSTLDSFLFLSGQTMGRDLLAYWFPHLNPNFLTKVGMWLATAIAILLILLYPAVIDLWYVLGSALIPGMLVPVLGVYLPLFRLRSPFIYLSLLAPVLLSGSWLVMGTLFGDEGIGYAFSGIEPFYPGLILAIAIWLIGRERQAPHPAPDRD
jgi:solute:Na+ symporter, SSS family